MNPAQRAGRDFTRLARLTIWIGIALAGLILAGAAIGMVSRGDHRPERMAVWQGSEGESSGVRSKALPAWRRFAVAVGPTSTRPMIAVVIDDMGIDRRRSARAIALRSPLTLAFLPYATDLAAQAAAARAAGHELLVHIPMEPTGTADPGPGALTTQLSQAEIRVRLAADLSRFEGFVGVNNHMGSRATGDLRVMLPVIDELKTRGLLFLDSRTAPDSLAADLARAAGVAFAVRDIFLDNDAIAEAVRQQLSALEMVARRQGYAVAIGHPHDGTLNALAPWLDAIENRGFALVPLSAIVRFRQDREAGPRARG